MNSAVVNQQTVIGDSALPAEWSPLSNEFPSVDSDPGLTGSRTDAIEVAYVTLGTVLVIAGILIPRFKGPVEVTTTGVKGEILPIDVLDPRWEFALIGTGAVRPLVRTASTVDIGWQTLTGPVRPSDVPIRAVLDAAAEQGWSTEQDDAGRHVLSSPMAPEKLVLPANPDWMATHELLRVLDASGLQVPSQGDKDSQ